MLDKIKVHWNTIKAEYEDRYNIPFLNDFEKSKTYLKKMEHDLLVMQQAHPSDVDIICTLASVRLELRDSEDFYINILEDFLNNFGHSLDNIQKARIYTNIAFCNFYSNEALGYLSKASKLKSPFGETYVGLGLCYFSKYQLSKEKDFLFLSRKYFEMAMKIEDNYEYIFNYAVCLYELKEYEQAKKIFLDLLAKYPNRMRLMLCLAYCEVYLGNRDQAIYYLAQVKTGQDKNYNLDTDDITDYQVFDVYYLLEEYDIFLTCWDDGCICEYYTVDWEHYFYVLWLKERKEQFFELEEKNRLYLEEAIKEAIASEDYDSEEERQAIIAEWQKDKREFEKIITRIKEGTLKPTVKLDLYPEYSCFMVDCIRHKLF